MSDKDFGHLWELIGAQRALFPVLVDRIRGA
jgi:hypothetical protein